MTVTILGNIPSGGITSSTFYGIGNLATPYYNATTGGPGTYTRAGTTWTKQS